MQYGIHPLSSIGQAPFRWRYATLKEAQEEAKRICTERHVEVIVFEICGTFRPTAEYEECTPNS